MTTHPDLPPAKLSLSPFRGVRYSPDRISGLADVTSPPYDVVVRPDGIHYLETADPHNVVRLILPQSPDPAERHELAARTLRSWQRDGILIADPEPALYVYEQHDGALLQRGVIGALGLDGPVLPHEAVMAATVADRAALMRATAANLEPLLLSYRGDCGSAGAGSDGTEDDVPDRGRVGGGTARGATARSGDKTAGIVTASAARPPLLSTTTDDGVRHKLWAVTDPAQIRTITEDLAGCRALIADGHHRWSTYRLLQRERRAESTSQPPSGTVSPWDLGLVLLVDTARYPLRVRAIHRVLYRLPLGEALARLGEAFHAERIDGSLADAMTALAQAAPAGNSFVLAGDGGYHLLTGPDPGLLAGAVRADRPPAWRHLDATVLHSVLLDRVWNVPDSPDHIGYLHDTAAAVQQAARRGGTAVLMHPVDEDVVRELAEAGVTMPRKSTSFGPKPATGLVLRDLTLG